MVIQITDTCICNAEEKRMNHLTSSNMQSNTIEQDRWYTTVNIIIFSIQKIRNNNIVSRLLKLKTCTSFLCHRKDIITQNSSLIYYQRQDTQMYRLHRVTTTQQRFNFTLIFIPQFLFIKILFSRVTLYHVSRSNVLQKKARLLKAKSFSNGQQLRSARPLESESFSFNPDN